MLQWNQFLLHCRFFFFFVKFLRQRYKAKIIGKCLQLRGEAALDHKSEGNYLVRIMMPPPLASLRCFTFLASPSPSDSTSSPSGRAIIMDLQTDTNVSIHSCVYGHTCFPPSLYLCYDSNVVDGSKMEERPPRQRSK